MSFGSYQEYLKKGKSVKLSDHYTLFDVCNSQEAIKHEIDNTPISPQIITNAGLVIKNILEPCCSHFMTRPDVSCIFRCPTLNNLLPGHSDTSQHLFGQAVDFTIVGTPLILIVSYIRNHLNFDQLILESSWIHCSFSSARNRKEVLKNADGKYIAF